MNAAEDFMSLATSLESLLRNAPLVRDAASRGNLAVLKSLLGPAWRGLVEGRGRGTQSSAIPVGYRAHFEWTYQTDQPALVRLYEAAKSAQWNGATDLDWSTPVDPLSEDKPLLPYALLPMYTLPGFLKLPQRQRAEQRRSTTAWLLSQFLHGEQGALFASCQVTEAVPWFDAKLFGSTQVVDEGRHVEVFHRYLSTKVERLYEINENLYVIIDAIMSDSRWDLKFLGMQIMIEGLALGAFGLIRAQTGEPLLRQMLSFVIADEARHVHYGVLALERYVRELSDRERRDREDWAFEVSLLMRNRFLGRELYDEYYAHLMTLAEWDKVVLASPMMQMFRTTMFKRIIPNLKRIGLLSDRVRPRYDELGLLAFEHGRAAPDLTAADLMSDEARPSA
jgi:hypothetical protein